MSEVRLVVDASQVLLTICFLKFLSPDRLKLRRRSPRCLKKSCLPNQSVIKTHAGVVQW